jgi:hypothetical protein
VSDERRALCECLITRISNVFFGNLSLGTRQSSKHNPRLVKYDEEKTSSKILLFYHLEDAVVKLLQALSLACRIRSLGRCT